MQTDSCKQRQQQGQGVGREVGRGTAINVETQPQDFAARDFDLAGQEEMHWPWHNGEVQLNANWVCHKGQEREEVGGGEECGKGSGSDNLLKLN